MNDIDNKNLFRVSESSLRSIVEQIFEKMGVPSDDGRIATDVLISADMRGVESHGVSNMLRKYIRDYRQDKLNPKPNWKIIRESQSIANIDGDSCLGLIIATKAMDIAIKKAKQTGVGVVTIRNSGHMGMLAYYVMRALDEDMIGVAMTSTPPIMVPTFGVEPRLGSNPIALAAPAIKESPFVYDAATTVVSSNKIDLIERNGEEVPAGWIADSDGMPIMSKSKLDMTKYPGWRHPFILPLGSIPELASHKGYGLSCVTEILSSILSGAGFSALPDRSGYAHYVAAYDIESFMDKDEFKETMDKWLRTLRSTKTVPGRNRVLYPGLLEAENEMANRQKGIPLHVEVIKWLDSMCDELSIKPNLSSSL